MDVSLSRGCRAFRKSPPIEPQNPFLRVSVDGGRCSGFQYRSVWWRQSDPDDIVIERDGAGVLIDCVVSCPHDGLGDRLCRRADRRLLQAIKNPNAPPPSAAAPVFDCRYPATTCHSHDCGTWSPRRQYLAAADLRILLREVPTSTSLQSPPCSSPPGGGNHWFSFLHFFPPPRATTASLIPLPSWGGVRGGGNPSDSRVASRLSAIPSPPYTRRTRTFEAPVPCVTAARNRTMVPAGAARTSVPQRCVMDGQTIAFQFPENARQAQVTGARRAALDTALELRQALHARRIRRARARHRRRPDRRAPVRRRPPGADADGCVAGQVSPPPSRPSKNVVLSSRAKRRRLL